MKVFMWVLLIFNFLMFVTMSGTMFSTKEPEQRKVNMLWCSILFVMMIATAVIMEKFI